MSARTPGPWGVRITETGSKSIFAVDGSWIATTHKKAWPTEDWANARLLAAAPKLLEALRGLQANPNDPRAHREALAAIAQAEGGAA